MRRIGIAECLPGSSWIPAQPGPIARFRLVVPFLGVRISLTYEVIRFVPDREVLLHASNGVLQATDRAEAEAGLDPADLLLHAPYASRFT